MGRNVKVSRKNADLLETEAIAFYRPFPLKKLTAGDLLKYIAGTLSSSDYVMAVLATLAVTLVAMLGPKLNQLLFGLVAESGEGKQMITRLSGGIELNNVSFRYNETMPNVVDDLSLKIRPG